jgi:hypothetical protein
MDVTDILLPGLRASKPCPFATEADVDNHELQIVRNTAGNLSWVACRCGARSPVERDPINAVKRWNIRYADVMINRITLDAGRARIADQRAVDDTEAKFSAMQVENNRLLERARTAEAALELTTTLAQKAVER